ncbi:MAG: hypothetical protein F4089_01285 [Gammaproteobacteria bacterium]|nr:hypothetical protein [Gammaproteobacteria bacterium]
MGEWRIEVAERLAGIEAKMVTKDELAALSNEIAVLQGTLEGVAWVVRTGLIVLTVFVAIVALPRVQVWWGKKRAAAHEAARRRLLTRTEEGSATGGVP